MRPDINRSPNQDAIAIVTAFMNDEDATCLSLNDTEAALMRVVYEEMGECHYWNPSPRMCDLLAEINAKLEHWRKQNPSN